LLGFFLPAASTLRLRSLYLRSAECWRCSTDASGVFAASSSCAVSLSPRRSAAACTMDAIQLLRFYISTRSRVRPRIASPGAYLVKLAVLTRFCARRSRRSFSLAAMSSDHFITVRLTPPKFELNVPWATKHLHCLRLLYHLCPCPRCTVVENRYLDELLPLDLRGLAGLRVERRARAISL